MLYSLFKKNGILVSLALFLFSSILLAHSNSPPKPLHWDQAEYSLLTVGRGEHLYMRYGHTLLRLTDLQTKKQDHLNWGIFDFSDPISFAFQFFKGILPYKLGNSSASFMHYLYGEREKRSVESNVLNLTPQQKKHLFEIIQSNFKPENLYFPYQYFYKNCATIPRDHLNTILGGKLKEHFSAIPADQNFRTYVRDYLNKPPAAGFFLDILMNSRLDQPISQWEEMFLPAKLQKNLESFPALDDQLQPIPDKNLLAPGKILIPHPDVPPSSTSPQMVFSLISWVLIALGALLFFKTKSTLSQRFLGFLMCVWALFSGSLGTVMAGAWSFSEHLDLHHNVHLFVFWPLDLLLLWPGCHMILKGSLSKKILLYLKKFAVAHLFFLFIFLLTYLIQKLNIPLGPLLLEQNVDRTVPSIIPVASIFYIFMSRIHEHKRTPPI